MKFTCTNMVVSVLLASCVSLAGCATTDGGGIGGALSSAKSAFTGGSGTDVNGKSTIQSDYAGKRASIAVLRFTDATGGRATGYRWYSSNVGDSMARKLTSGLLATKRFRIVQRKNMSDLMNEINFGGSGAVTPGSAAKFGKMLGARLIVTASITDFEDAGGAKGGAGSSSNGLLGALSGAMKKTYMAVNLEVVDVQTSEIVASEQIDATIRDTNFGSLLGGAGGKASAIGGLSGWDTEPKGKALQKVINSAIGYLEESVPQRYYTDSPA